jgi:probable HAF family extracellular repeat protein
MKSKILTYIIAMTVFAALAIPVRLAAQEQHYTVIDLGTLGGTFSLAGGMNNKGWVDGFSTLTGDTQTHAFLWRHHVITDLGTLGGPNSSASFPLNQRGEVAGVAETSNSDPNGEDFCGFGTHLICLAFRWRHGVMTPLPTLGGNNGQASEINNRGQVAGSAENTTKDPTCVPPQVLQFEAVIWKNGQVQQQLPTFPGDPDGVANAINDKGQTAGVSGNCTMGIHALLWEDGTATDLGNLGGTMNNVPLDINDEGQVVGLSNLPGDTTNHAFLWTEDDGMQDLGTLPGDFSSVADGINSKGQVVGGSFDTKGNGRAFLWQDGVMTDLNTLIPASSPLFLIEASGTINSRGQIAGVALQISTSQVHAFLATPCDEEQTDNQGCNDEGATTGRGQTSERPKVALPENVRRLLRQRLGLRYHIPGPGPGPTG